MKNVIRWIACVVAVVVIVFCFISIVNSILLAADSGVAAPDKSAALTTLFTSIAILLSMVGLFVVCLIINLKNDEGKLPLPMICIGGITALCMILAFAFGFGNISNQSTIISEAESHQRFIESLSNTALASKIKDENLLDGTEDADFLALIDSEISLNETNHERFFDMLKERGLIQKMGWKEQIWFRTHRTQLAFTVFSILANLLIFGTLPLLYGLYGLIKKKEEFTLIKHK